MSRVIRVESASRSRERLLQGIAAALRFAASRSSAPPDEADLLAFLDACVSGLRQSVDDTATAWEKRGYWLKADRFRQEWAWAERIGIPLQAALASGDLDRARALGMELATPIREVRLPASWTKARPWAGAWERRNGSSKKPQAS
ncbi:MAG TPA: hypothetical protein VLD63_09280 [Anaerolineales bacterium]|nr:hypothetical protein [Anaerolineales bacterium]